MQFGQRLYDRQTKTDAAPRTDERIVGLAEGLHHQLQLVVGDADAVVAHDDIDAFGRRFDADLDNSVVTGELDRVGKKIEQDLLQRAASASM